MGRRSEGVRVVRPKNSAVWRARWTHEGKRYTVSTGERDHERALHRAAELYADAIASRHVRRPVARAAAPAGRLLELVGEWLAAVESSYAPETIATWVIYARTHWGPHFHDSLGRVLAPGALADYGRARLERVTRKTVLKELSAMRGFLGWLVERGQLAELPPKVELPRRALGVRSGTQREHAVELSPAQVVAFLAELPERTPTGYPLRARFALAFETGLRPATIDRLELGRHWSPGARVLTITADIDKARYARTVPLSPRAVAILEAHAPHPPLVDLRPFPPVVARKHVVAAARRAGVPGASAYDLRHARATHDLEAGGDLVGVGFGLGHKQATTTSKYAHGSLRAAERILELRRRIPAQSSSVSFAIPASARNLWGDRRGLNPRQLEPQSRAKAARVTDYAWLRRRRPAEPGPETPVPAHCARIRAALADLGTERTMLELFLEEDEILGELPACTSPGGDA